jgi:hypothetical protein
MHPSTHTSKYAGLFELSLMIQAYCTLCTAFSIGCRWSVGLVYVNEMRWKPDGHRILLVGLMVIVT